MKGNDMKRRTNHIESLACAIVALATLVVSVQAQQFPIPTTVAQVPGPATGNTMTKEYVQMVGRMAYFWGWPLVNTVNRAAAFSKAPEPGHFLRRVASDYEASAASARRGSPLPLDEQRA